MTFYAALIGVTVVSLAVNLPGPLAAARLAELGAAVTKVEPATGIRSPPPRPTGTRG